MPHPDYARLTMKEIISIIGEDHITREARRSRTQLLEVVANLPDTDKSRLAEAEAAKSHRRNDDSNQLSTEDNEIQPLLATLARMDIVRVLNGTGLSIPTKARTTKESVVAYLSSTGLSPEQEEALREAVRQKKSKRSAPRVIIPDYGTRSPIFMQVSILTLA
jgi:hypothetical protein